MNRSNLEEKEGIKNLRFKAEFLIVSFTNGDIHYYNTSNIPKLKKISKELRSKWTIYTDDDGKGSIFTFPANSPMFQIGKDYRIQEV